MGYGLIYQSISFKGQEIAEIGYRVLLRNHLWAQELLEFLNDNNDEEGNKLWHLLDYYIGGTSRIIEARGYRGGKLSDDLNVVPPILFKEKGHEPDLRYENLYVGTIHDGGYEEGYITLEKLIDGIFGDNEDAKKRLKLLADPLHLEELRELEPNELEEQKQTVNKFKNLLSQNEYDPKYVEINFFHSN